MIIERAGPARNRGTTDAGMSVRRPTRSLARERGESFGATISSLVREALRRPDTVRYEIDVPVFEVREDASPITPEMVQSALEEG